MAPARKGKKASSSPAAKKAKKVHEASPLPGQDLIPRSLPEEDEDKLLKDTEDEAGEAGISRETEVRENSSYSPHPSLASEIANRSADSILAQEDAERTVASEVGNEEGASIREDHLGIEEEDLESVEDDLGFQREDLEAGRDDLGLETDDLGLDREGLGLEEDDEGLGLAEGDDLHFDGEEDLAGHEVGADEGQEDVLASKEKETGKDADEENAEKENAEKPEGDQENAMQNDGEMPNGDINEAQTSSARKDSTREGSSSSGGKIFIGGLTRGTTTEMLTRHFKKYGEIIDSVIMKNRSTGHPRGFGFVTFADPSVVDVALKDTHILDGKMVEAKPTVPREVTPTLTKGPKTKKVFVGGLKTSMTEDEFKSFFEKFGKVAECQIMQDHSTGRSRGFGFVTFESEQSVEDLLSHGNMHDIDGKQVEIKKAEPKRGDDAPASYDRGGPRRGRGGSGYDGNSGYYGGYGGGPVPAPYYGGGGGPYRGDGRPGGGYAYGAAYGYGNSGYGGFYGFGGDVDDGYGGMGYNYAGYGASGSGYGNVYGGGGSGGGYGGSGRGYSSGRYHPYGR